MEHMQSVRGSKILVLGPEVKFLQPISKQYFSKSDYVEKERI